MVITPEMWQRLAAADVFPLPFAMETNWTRAGWEVVIELVVDVTDGGHEAIPIWTYQRDYAGDQPTNGEVDVVQAAALTDFAVRLREVLA